MSGVAGGELRVSVGERDDETTEEVTDAVDTQGFHRGCGWHRGDARIVRWDDSRNAFSIGAGSDLQGAYRALREGWGVTLPAGICLGVGLGGYVCGGGYGPLSRRHGLVADHLYGVEVITVDAEGRANAVTATADGPHRDLWWYLNWTRQTFADLYTDTGGVPVPDENSGGCYINYPTRIWRTHSGIAPGCPGTSSTTAPTTRNCCA